MQDHAETLEAFYDRVMSRVCEEYRKEAEAQSLDVVDLLEQKWREKLMRYTGWRCGSSAVTSNEISVARALSPVDAASSGDEEEDDDVSSSMLSAQASPVAAVAAPVIGQPIAQLPIAAVSTSSSVFTKMLGGKRKLHQLDGSVSDDDEDEDEDQKQQEGSQMSDTLLEMIEGAHDEDNSKDGLTGMDVSVSIADACGEVLVSDSKDTEEEKEYEAQEDASSLEDTTSVLISGKDLVPVSGLSGSDFPLQLAAEYSKFRHRGKRQGYFGELHAIVLTWPSHLGPSDALQPGELVWCYNDPEQRSDNYSGLVEILTLSDTLNELRVKHPDGTVATISLAQVRRLREYLIRNGTVRLRSEQ